MKYLKYLSLLVTAVIIFFALPLHAGADIGPKPSVTVGFKGMDNRVCYGTLLSKNISTGPYSVWVDDVNHAYSDDPDIDIKRAFAQYEDPDGYYFLGYVERVSDGSQLCWGYYPPDDFKILLYYPDSGVFASSGAYQKYAFDSYYTVDMDGFDVGSVEYDETKSSDARLEAYRSYNYTGEIVSFLVRMIITVAVELAVAMIFTINEKKRLLFIGGVNIVTQLILNIILNVASYRYGALYMALVFAALELFVILIEAVLYCVFLNKFPAKRHSAGLYIAYAAAANIASFALGLWLAVLIPALF